MFIVLCIIAAYIAFLVTLLLLALVFFGPRILDRVKDIPEHKIQLNTLELHLLELRNSFDEALHNAAASGEQETEEEYRSFDGKYSASTLQELMEKMAADPDSGLMNSEDLKNFFDDSNDKDEDWKK